MLSMHGNYIGTFTLVLYAKSFVACAQGNMLRIIGLEIEKKSTNSGLVIRCYLATNVTFSRTLAGTIYGEFTYKISRSKLFTSAFV
jgi:hypothetical protein